MLSSSPLEQSDIVSHTLPVSLHSTLVSLPQLKSRQPEHGGGAKQKWNVENIFFIRSFFCKSGSAGVNYLYTKLYQIWLGSLRFDPSRMFIKFKVHGLISHSRVFY